MPDMFYVYSSHVVRWGYDEDTQEFHVHYGPTAKNPGGRTVVYHEVPAGLAADMLESPSAGQAIHGNLKGKFRFSYQ